LEPYFLLAGMISCTNTGTELEFGGKRDWDQKAAHSLTCCHKPELLLSRNT